LNYVPQIIGAAAVVAALGHVAGAHVNPAVTLGLAVTKNFPWPYVPAYIGAQLLGAILGALGTWIALGDRAREVANLAATYPVGEVGDFRALTVEALVTFILVFVVVLGGDGQPGTRGSGPHSGRVRAGGWDLYRGAGDRRCPQPGPRWGR
jgi:glycerol uptake facilitator-like aquaporin